MTENNHPADALLRSTVDEVFEANDAGEAIAALGKIAGGVENAILNLVYNLPEDATRLTLFKLLKDAHEAGDDEFVLSTMEFTSKATLMYQPDALDVFKQSFRDDFDNGIVR